MIYAVLTAPSSFFSSEWISLDEDYCLKCFNGSVGDGCILRPYGLLGVGEAEAEGSGTEAVSGELVVERRAGSNTATTAAEWAEVCITRGGENASRVHVSDAQVRLSIISGTFQCLKSTDYFLNKKHLKNVGPIRHCELPHAAFSNSTLPFTRCRYSTPLPSEPKPAIAIAQPACDSSDTWWMAMQNRCAQQQQQRQRVTEGTAMDP